MSYSNLVKSCIDLSIELQATKIVNLYCKFWNTDPSQYKLYHLDCIYYYLIWAQKNNKLDIFDYNEKSLFHTLFIV